MTREEALQILKYEMQTHIASEVDLHIAMGMAIEALQTARPTVDKDYLIRLIQEAVYDGDACERLIDMVDRPTGHWIWNKDGFGWGIGAWCCSECGRNPETWWEADIRLNPLNCAGSHYCDNCGADMRGGE